MRLTDFAALTFDVYGTLIDWESGMIAGLAPLTARLAAPPTRDEILQAHARHESAAQAWTPAKRYRDLLPVVYRRLAEEWGVPVSWGECLAYGASVADWPAFPDSEAALADLKRHFKLIVLTNTDNDSFAHSEAKLGLRFDGAYTAEDVGSYKPADRNFEYMLEMLAQRGIGTDKILHVAESMFHDHVPATRHGLARCWIYRRHAQKGFGATMHPGDMPTVDWRFTSMAELAAAVRAELD
ncbi:MAG: haloacid dehalogenase type II [Pseudomonadota bacterium]